MPPFADLRPPQGDSQHVKHTTVDKNQLEKKHNSSRIKTIKTNLKNHIQEPRCTSGFLIEKVVLCSQFIKDIKDITRVVEVCPKSIGSL